jgi:hypothetical protein
MWSVDEMSQRAVEASSDPGAVEETQEIASKSERILRPSMAVRTFHPVLPFLNLSFLVYFTLPCLNAIFARIL